MFKILIPAIASLGLIAFAAKPQPAVTDAGASSAMATMGWHISHEEQTAKLAYGLANSDQLAMMVTCAPGDATALVYGDVRPATSIGSATSSMDETQVAIRDPSLQKLADTGVLDVVGEGGAHRISASATERRAIGQFLVYCSREQA